MNLKRSNSPEARAFDFWIGDWNIQQKILNPDGTWLHFPAKTSVTQALDGCVLIEHWEGNVQFFWEDMREPQPMQGLSVRSYDLQSGRWQIHWMDSRNPSFSTPYIGGFDNEKGQFLREWVTPQGKRLGRITFADITSDSVHWELAVSSDDGQTWTVLWTMEMQRYVKEIETDSNSGGTQS